MAPALRRLTAVAQTPLKGRTRYFLLPVQQVTGPVTRELETVTLMPSHERFPMFLNYRRKHHMDLKAAPTEQRTEKGKTFVSQVHLALHHSTKYKVCYFALEENKCIPMTKQTECEQEQNSDRRNKKILGSYNSERIPSILILQMIDKTELEDNRLLSTMYSGKWPNLRYIQQSEANHTSLGFSGELTQLPSKLEIQTPLDKIIHRTNLYPTEKEQAMHKKRGFSSITITARRNTASLKHAPKEIASDPASTICRNNDLLIKVPISPSEHDHRCRCPDNQECYMQTSTRRGVFYSNKFPGTNCKDFILNEKQNNRPLSSCRKTMKARFSISYAHFRVVQTCPAVIYYVDRSLSVPVGKSHIPDQRIYSSTTFFKINCHLSSTEKISNIKKTMSHSIDFHSYNSPTFIEESNREKQAPSDVCLPTENPFLSGLFTKTVTVTNPQSEIKYLEIVKGHGTPHDHPDGQHHGPHQEAPPSLCSKDSSIERILKKDPINLHDIYAQQDLLTQNISNHGAERSSITKFNFIFGRQISKLDKEKQKENIPPNGYKECNANRRIEIYIKGNIPLSTEIGKNIILFQLGLLNENNEIFPKMMSLQEALEHHRPDFISNSQERLQRLEVMVHRRKIHQFQESTKSKSQQILQPSIYMRRKMYTVPHPSSDNLFKPKERTISEKEMHQRSKRIYNSLPEVKRRKEEQEKRILSQSNRMRAELFKKKILNQILQRSTD
uniref:ALMS motif domain-containing protein n=1 Tax=Leptobrachium leishanense TaxID=445787 RepID=A0A8C5Q0P4_9ANUR